MRRTLTAAVIALWVTWSLSCDAQTYRLRLDPKVGTTYAYKTVVSGPQSLEATNFMKAIRSDSEKVVIENRVGVVVVDGHNLPSEAAAAFRDMVITMSFARSGRLLETDVAGVSTADAAAMKGQAGGSFCSFPDKPVKV